MLVQLARIFALVSFVAITACKEYKRHEIKDFRLYVNTDDAELKSAIEELADQFNKDVGAKALTIVDSKSEANSNISFVKDLRDAKGAKLGLGQWVTTEKQEQKFKAYGSQENVTVYHSMQLEFDTENFAGKISGLKDKSSDEYKHLYHLFCHEVGHGMQLDHSHDKQDVMYDKIPKVYQRTIDFDGFFSYVRSYLNVVPSSELPKAI